MTKSYDAQKLLAIALAFVMVSGMVLPAYAAHDDIIYQNGNNPIPNSGLFIDFIIIADDFVLSQDFIVTDAHFTFNCFVTNNCPNIEPLFFAILEDDGGPGDVISSGLAQEVEVMFLEGDRFEVWFDFEDGVPLDGGVTYWFALTYMPDTFEFEDPRPLWEISDVVTGNFAFRAETLPPTEWSPFAVDMWFQLTGDGEVVGGEFIGVDTTTLLLAGLQSSAIWMLPILIGAAGVGAFYIKTRMNKDN